MDTETILVPKYKVGDRIRIRPVEKMHDLVKRIQIRGGWNPQMEEYCGQTYIISNVELSKLRNYYKYKFFNAPESMNVWVWSEDMFDLDITYEEIEKQEHEFLELIGF